MNAPTSDIQLRPEATDPAVKDFLDSIGHLPIAERIAAIGAHSATVSSLRKDAGSPPELQKLMNQQRQLNRAKRQAEMEAAAAAKAEARASANVTAPAVAVEPAAIPPAVGEVLPEAQLAAVAVPEVTPKEFEQETPKRRYRFNNEADALELLPILTKQMHVADDSASGRHHFAAGEAGILRIIKNFPHLAGHVEIAINHLGIRSPRINEQLIALIDHVQLPLGAPAQPASNPRNLSGTAQVLAMMGEVRDQFGQVIAVPDPGPFPRIKHPEKHGRAAPPPKKVHE
jgi:hypothetical protein